MEKITKEEFNQKSDIFTKRISQIAQRIAFGEHPFMFPGQIRTIKQTDIYREYVLIDITGSILEKYCIWWDRKKEMVKWSQLRI